jgi:hypothetical protein
VWALILAAVFISLRQAGGAAIGLFGTITAFIGYGVDRHLYIPIGILGAAILYLLTHKLPASERGFGSVARQGLYLGIGFGLYEMGRKYTEGDAASALSNSARVLDFERRLRLNFEPDLQHFVLHSHHAVTLFARIYSSLYLPVVLFGLVWFLLADRAVFRVLRNALAVSAALGLLTWWLFPVAPPRLTPDSGVVDFHLLLGREHRFMNDFAAVPSLHVGWTLLVGFIFFRTYRRFSICWLAWIPGALMFITVMVTGNPYWFDGAIGMLYTLVPATLLLDMPRLRGWWSRWLYLPSAARQPGMLQSTVRHPWALLDVAALGALLICMVVGALLDPGFTDYWGYMVAQMVCTAAAVMWLTQRFASEGGLSWLTHVIIVVVTYADTFGTAAGMYDRYTVYDKITHFGGGAILAATAYEIILALRLRGAMSWSLHARMFIAIAVSVTLGAVWEFYEVFGDAIFDTGRHAGSLDTVYDLVSDLSGAVVAIVLLAHLEPGRVQVSPFDHTSAADHAPTRQIGEPV